MIQVPDEVVKKMLVAIDDVAYYLFNRSEHADDEEVRVHCKSLLEQLREAKHDFENKAKSQDGLSLYRVPLFRGDDIR